MNPEEELSKHIEKSINKIIKREGYINYEIDKKFISTDGGNYLGILHTVDVKGMTADGEKETNIFVKSAIPGDLQVFSISDLFMQEVFVYRELSKIFTELQDQANVPSNERYNLVRCYEECNSEAIFLENVAKEGYKTIYRMDAISLKLAELSIQQLARFHSLSFIIQEKRPEYYQTNLKERIDPLEFNEHWKNFFNNVCNNLMNYLDGETKEKLEAAIPHLMNEVPLYKHDYTTSTYLSLCHGDFKPNNILMKEIDGEITSVIPVDYQLIHYGSPVLDFIYFIFVGTDQELRRNHLEHLKDVYYDNMRSFLKYFDMNVDIVYPRKEFDRMYKEYLDYGLTMFIHFIPLNFCSDVPDLMKLSLTSFNMKLNPKFEGRMHEVLSDFIEWGYL